SSTSPPCRSCCPASATSRSRRSGSRRCGARCWTRRVACSATDVSGGGAVLESDLRSLRHAWATPPAAEEDPFERFDRAQGIGMVRDPYPALAAMRAAGPVQRIDLHALAGMSPVGPERELYSVLGWDAVCEVLRDAARFSSAGYATTMGVVMGHTILEMDGVEHVRHRALISRAFTRRALERWERELVRPIVNAHVDRFAARGAADLVRELTFPVPVRVIAGMMGLPPESHDEFHRRAVELISVGIDLEAGKRASRALTELYAPVLADRRAAPRDDLISVLAHAEYDGARLDDEAIYAFLRLLAPAGAETTYRSSSNLLFGLLAHPDQLDALRRERALLPRAIEEGLRWEPPLLAIMRTATRDTEVAGVPIPAGATL